VVIAIIAILAAVLLPALSRAKQKAIAISCLNNSKQLMVAWQLYPGDNSESLPGNYSDSYARALTNSANTWCDGWLDFQLSRPDNTNTALLLSSQLGAYTKASGIYKCPGDRNRNKLTGLEHVRSYSMNCFVGKDLSPSPSPAFVRFLKTTDFTAPANTFVFLDERFDSINDGSFLVSMTGYDPQLPQPSGYTLVDGPASYHSKRTTFSFADGSSVHHKWSDLRTIPDSFPGPPTGGDADIYWLMDHTTKKR
jgi:type II secretory pathway pseudopilin PulG